MRDRSIADLDEVESAGRRVRGGCVTVSSFEDCRDFVRVEAAASSVDHRRDHRAHHVAEKTVCLDPIDEDVAGAGPFTREHAAHGGLYARAERAERGEVMLADKDLRARV